MIVQTLCLSLAASLICATGVPKPAVKTGPAGQDVTPVHEIVRSTGPIHWTGNFKFDRAKDLSEKCNGLPVYRWAPDGQDPRGIVLAVHGLTLHGLSYEVLARGFAAGGFVFVAPDMRGYGANQEKDAPEDLRKIDNEKSYQDIVKLAQALNDQYGQDIPIAMLGESLGTSFCVRVAAEHHDLVDAVIVSAPTSRLSPVMYLAPSTIAEGFKAIFTPRHEMSYKVFFDRLVSNNELIRQELDEDPLVLKRIPLQDLLETTSWVGKTDKWARGIRRDTPILVLQGGGDKAMVPKAVTRLTRRIRSTDQTIRWISGYGHLLLETDYLGPPALDAITAFINDHSGQQQEIRRELYKEMKRFGAKELPTSE